MVARTLMVRYITLFTELPTSLILGNPPGPGPHHVGFSASHEPGNKYEWNLT